MLPQAQERVARWPGIAKALEGLRLPGYAVGRLRAALLSIPGELRPALDRVSLLAQEMAAAARSHAGGRGGRGRGAASTAANALYAAVAELQVLGRYLSLLGAAPPALSVVCDPLMVPPGEGYTGVLFSVHLLTPAPASGGGGPANAGGAGGGGGAGGALRSTMLAVGGRYDGLLRALWPPPAVAAWPAPCGVGATLNLDKIAAASMATANLVAPAKRRTVASSNERVMGSNQATSSAWVLATCVPGLAAHIGHARLGPGAGVGGVGTPPVSHADVLVASRGPSGLLELRLQVVAQCVAAGVPTELMPRVAPRCVCLWACAQGCAQQRDPIMLGPFLP